MGVKCLTSLSASAYITIDTTEEMWEGQNRTRGKECRYLKKLLLRLVEGPQLIKFLGFSFTPQTEQSILQRKILIQNKE